MNDLEKTLKEKDDLIDQLMVKRMTVHLSVLIVGLIMFSLGFVAGYLL